MTVKFKVKVHNKSFIIEIICSNKNNVTIGGIKEAVASSEEISKVLSGRDFDLSLNGKDALVNGEVPITDIGIVPGDIIKLIVKDSSTPNPDRGKTQTTDAAVIDRAEACSSISASHSHVGNGQSQTDGASVIKDHSVAHDVPSAEQNHTEYEDADTIQDQQARDLMNEPLLVCESCDKQVPQSLNATYCLAHVTSAHEALFVVLHVLMTETGFKPLNCELYAMPSQWRQPGGVFKTRYSVLACPEKTVSLTCVCLGSVCNVLVTVSKSDIKYKHQFTPAHYIVSVGKSAHETYTSLRKLSMVFKDKISFALLQKLREESDSPLPGLDSISMELQLLILKHLDAWDLARLASVNKHFQVLSKDQPLWRRLYLRDFGRRLDSNHDLTRDWYTMYKEKYILTQQLRSDRRHFFRPPPFRDPYADPYPLHPGSNQPPGFVGGDYDRDPNFGGLFGPGGGGPPLAFPRPRFDPIGPHPDMRRPQRPQPPLFGPRSGRPRRDPGFGGGGFGFM